MKKLTLGNVVKFAGQKYVYGIGDIVVISPVPLPALEQRLSRMVAVLVEDVLPLRTEGVCLTRSSA